MPSNKSFYEGSVFLNNAVDNLDLSGWINRQVLTAINKGQSVIRINGSYTFTKGDIIIEAVTNRFIGKFKEQDGVNITLEKPIEFAISANTFIRVRPKFEIVKIDILGVETYILELVPVDRKHIGSLLPDRDTWASNVAADFGGSGGSAFTTGSLVPTETIEGRFQRVVIDNAGAGTAHAAICYLKSAPTIM